MDDEPNPLKLELDGKSILVTGANGFIGTHLTAIAVMQGAKVTGIDLPGTLERANRVRRSFGGSAIAVSETAELNAEVLFKHLVREKLDLVIHLAGTTVRSEHANAWTRCTSGNAMTTANLIEALLNMPSNERPALVVPGSQMEYGCAPMPWTEDRFPLPTTPYGVSKLSTTQMVQTAVRTGQLRAAVIRLAIVFGPAQHPVMLVPELIMKALAGKRIPTTAGTQKRRFVFVTDVVSMLLSIGRQLSDRDELPALINAVASPPVAVVDVVQSLLRYIGRPDLADIGALPSRPGEPKEAWPDTTAAEKLGFSQEMDLDDALSRTVRWYRDNPWFSDLIGFQ